MKNRGYSVLKSNGAWYVRWSEYKDGRRRQPCKRLASVAHYPKEKEAQALADEYMATVRKTQTIEAGSSVGEFATETFLPKCQQCLAHSTVTLYKQQWRRLEPVLGPMRLRDVRVCDAQASINAVYRDRGDGLGHDIYKQCKITVGVLFAEAIRLGHHPGPNPGDGVSVRGYGHNNHRENGAYSLEEVDQFLKLFPAGQVAVTIGLNAFLALREPELKALLPEDFDPARGVRIHRDTKTGNDEWLPVVAPLRSLLVDGWEPIDLRKAKRAILKRIAGTSLRWRGWYAFRRGMATNLYQLGLRPEEACLILRNSAAVCRNHYLKLEAEGVKADAMSRLEAAYAAVDLPETSQCAATVQ